MRSVLRRALALLCALVVLIPTVAFGANVGNAEASSSHYIEFGSYPQTEIVSQASDSGVWGKDWESEGDYLIDPSLFNTLESLSEDQWDANGDATVDGDQYRRIKADDATSSKSEDINFYDWTSGNTYHYFKYEPIKWRILEQNDSEAFLLSEIVLDDQMYSTKITGTLTWETSTMRSWLNGYDSSQNEYGTDYSNSNFIDTAFTFEEQAKIKTTALENKDNNKSGTDGGNDTSDKIYLLSEDEIYGSTATGYGFASNYKTYDTARQAKSSTYAKAMGAYADCDSDYLGNCDWWLRSPGSYPGLFVLAQYNGKVYRGGQHANSKSRGVRPALHLLLSEGDEPSEESEEPSGFIDPQNPGELLTEMTVSSEMGETKAIGFGGLRDGAELSAESSNESVVSAWIEGSSICLRTAAAGTADITVSHFRGEEQFGTYTLHVNVSTPAHTYEKDMSVFVGETLELTDESGDYSESYTARLLDSSIAEVEVSSGTTEGTPGTPARYQAVTTFAAGEYILYSNGKYLTVNGSTLGTSTDPERAARWTVSGSVSNVTLVCNGYYLNHSTSGVSLSTSNKNASWKFSSSNGLYFSSTKLSWFRWITSTYYLTCSSYFTVSTSQNNLSTLYSYISAEPGTAGESITSIRITGANIGETYVLIGETLYHITVSEASAIQTVTVISVDDVGQSVAANYTISGAEGTTYTIQPAAIANYDTPSSIEVTFGSEETATVTLVYTLNTDKSALASELAAVIAQGEYTDESYRVYANAIAAGREVYNKSRAMQTEVDAAVNSIRQAKSALTVKNTGYTQDTNGLDIGGKYVFVSNGYALGIVNGSLTRVAVSASGGTVQADDNCVWIVGGSSGSYTLQNKATGQYLSVKSSGFIFKSYSLSLTSSASKWKSSASGANVLLYTTVSYKNCYLSYSSGFTVATKSSSSCNMAIYK